MEKEKWVIRGSQIVENGYPNNGKLPVCDFWGCSTERGKANAKLIVASNDMLEALKLAREELLKRGVSYDTAAAYNIIDNAIKKATV